MVARLHGNKTSKIVCCVHFLGVKERYEEVFEQSATIKLRQGKLGGCWQDTAGHGVSVLPVVALLIFVFKIFPYSFMCRIEGKSSKPEQTFAETEVHAKETSSVISSLYIQLLTEDLTSEGK